MATTTPTTATTTTTMVRTLIVGTGDMALGLCCQYRLHTLTDEEERALATRQQQQQQHLQQQQQQERSRRSSSSSNSSTGSSNSSTESNFGDKTASVDDIVTIPAISSPSSLSSHQHPFRCSHRHDVDNLQFGNPTKPRVRHVLQVASLRYDAPPWEGDDFVDDADDDNFGRDFPDADVGTRNSRAAAGTPSKMTSKSVVLQQHFGGSHGAHVPMVDLYRGVMDADVVILAIPSRAVQQFLLEHGTTLVENGTVVVDVSNPTRKRDTFLAAVHQLSQQQQQQQLTRPGDENDDGYVNNDEVGQSRPRPAPVIRWVKALNDVNALSLLTSPSSPKRNGNVGRSKSPTTTTPSHDCPKRRRNSIRGNIISTTITGSDIDSTEYVRTVLQDAFGMSVRMLPPRPANVLTLEEEQTQLDWEWSHATILMIAIHWCWALYIGCRIHFGLGQWYDQLPAYSLNHAFGPSSLTGFALTQLPGIVAHIWRTFIMGRSSRCRDSDDVDDNKTNTNRQSISSCSIMPSPQQRRSFPRILHWGLAIRKHFGLISFFSLVCHVVTNAVVVAPMNARYHAESGFSGSGSSYFAPVDGDTAASSSSPVWYLPTRNFELSLFFGTLGFGLYCVVALSAVPSIGAAMNFAQWDLVFGKVIWIGMALAVVHCLWLVGWRQGDDVQPTTAMPSPGILTCVLPLFVMGLKVVQIALCRWNRYRTYRQRRMHNSHRTARGRNSTTGTVEFPSTWTAGVDDSDHPPLPSSSLHQRQERERHGSIIKKRHDGSLQLRPRGRPSTRTRSPASAGNALIEIDRSTTDNFCSSPSSTSSASPPLATPVTLDNAPTVGDIHDVPSLQSETAAVCKRDVDYDDHPVMDGCVSCENNAPDVGGLVAVRDLELGPVLEQEG